MLNEYIYLYIVIQSLCFLVEKILQVADLGFAPFAHLIDKVSSEKTPKKQVGCHDTQGHSYKNTLRFVP